MQKRDTQTRGKQTGGKLVTMAGFAVLVVVAIVALRSTNEQGGSQASAAPPAAASVAVAPAAPAPRVVRSQPLEPPPPLAPGGPPPADCKSCEGRRCDATISGCESLSGEERSRCQALLACVRSSHCASSGAPEPCLCGSASMEDCLLGKGNGPCRKELEKAAQPAAGESAARIQQIAERYYNPAFAIGRAMNLVVCDVTDCAGSCKP